MRAGSEYFLEPSEPAQRRYEAMRAYFVDGLAAGEVAARFHYSPASVHQMASELRTGSAQYFRSPKPGPRSARKADRVREGVLRLRAEDRSIEEIAAALAAAGTPVSALPKATHLTSYSYRVRRSSSERLLAAIAGRLRELGLATGAEGFNLDFHAIRHHGQDIPLEKHYVPQRSQRTRAVLTFFAQDHASQEMVYSNAELTKAEQAREVIAFADYWQQVSGSDPGLLVLDSKLTTYKVLDELSARAIRWLTLRERGPKLIRDLQALPDSEWKKVRVERRGRYREPEIHDQQVRIKGIDGPVRQLAVRNIGREHPTMLITNAHEFTVKQLFARYAERMTIENELDAYISGFHLNALSSGLPLNIDLDATLTVIAGNLYRLLARRLARYERATPDKLWRHFLDATGTVHATHDTLTVDLNLRTYHPVLIAAGFADTSTPIPWLHDRELRFRFPPR
jgi:hypothetical protein